MNQPIRILHVFSIMNRAGAETMIMNIYRNINRSKVQFDFIVHTQEKGDFDDEIESLGGKIYRVPKYKGINHFEYVKAWNIFFDNFGSKYSIIHSHIRSTANFFLPMAKKKGLITIIHSHSTSSGSGLSSIVKSVFQLRLRKIADYFFAASEEAGKWLFGSKIIEQKNFKILNNAIDTEKYKFNPTIRNKKRNELNLQNKFVIGHVGRFSKPKNHSFIIRIFKKILTYNEEAVLLLVGDGQLREQVEKQTRMLNISNNVIFTGVREDIPELLQAMDVFLFPSLYEGLGIVVIESQTAGLPTFISESIPKEARLTDLVNEISLEMPAHYWAKEINKYSQDYKREDKSISVKKKNYDIEENSKWLEDFYIGHSKK